jgi:hypothetical protein
LYVDGGSENDAMLSRRLSGRLVIPADSSIVDKKRVDEVYDITDINKQNYELGCSITAKSLGLVLPSWDKCSRNEI